MRLSILVPALESRPWASLVEHLKEQAVAAQAQGLGEAEVLVELDNGALKSGVKRSRLVARAKGDYLAFVDDDDRVSSDYVSALLAGSVGDPDVITFQLRFVHKDLGREEVWRYHLGCGDFRARGLMEANHLCAWRSDLARKVGWCPHLGYGDDQLWYRALYHTHAAKKEVHLGEVLYIYQYSDSVTANQQKNVRRFSYDYARGGLRVFESEEGETLVECRIGHVLPEWVNVVDPGGQVVARRLSRLRLIGVVTIA